MTTHQHTRSTAAVRLLTIAALALLTAGCAAPGGDAPAATRRILVVTGEDYAGHHWQQTAPVLQEELAADPQLTVECTADLADLRSPRIAEFDALVLHFKNYGALPGREGFDNLARFVEHGGGLVLIHFACGAFQEFASEFERLAGRVWNPELRGHDPHGEFTVEIVDRDHEITQGLADFAITDELYTCLDGSIPIHVLAEATSKVDGVRYPMAFVLRCGEGRVFHLVLGHDTTALHNPGAAELIRRGTAWAAAGAR